MKLIEDPEVQTVFDAYPENVKTQMHELRRLIIKTAEEMPEIESLEETLKWGEPSYLTKYGSTLRIDWKNKKPDQYAVYFKCTSKLVPTFRIKFSDSFKFEDNRAILFDLDEKIPEKELKLCIESALLYHKRKKLPDLGL